MQFKAGKSFTFSAWYLELFVFDEGKVEVWILKAAHLDRRAAERIARRDADDEILRFLYI